MDLPLKNGTVTTNVENEPDGEDKKTLVEPEAMSSCQDRPAVDRLVAALQKSSNRQRLRLWLGSESLVEAAHAADHSARRSVTRHWEATTALEHASRLRSVDALAATGPAYELARVAQVGAAALQEATEVWAPVFEVLSVGIQQLARNAQVWQSRLSMVGDVAIELQRRVNVAKSPVLLVAQEIQDRLSMVHQVAQSPTFQTWLQELPSERVQEGIRRFLEEVEEAEGLEQPDAVASDVAVAAEGDSAWIVSWLLSFLKCLQRLGVTPSERWNAYALLLPFACFLYTEQGNDEDHAELVSLIRQQHQAEMAQGLEHHQSSVELLKVMRASLALQQLEQSYEVAVGRAPIRDHWSGPVTGHLVKGDEVQVLEAAGKWRRVQSVDEEGRFFIGWMLNKHLRHLPV